jgi:hypothetical protein
METETSVQRDDFPRVYRVDAGTRRAINMLLVLLAGLFLLVTVLDARVLHRGSLLGNVIFVAVGSAAIVTGLGSGYNKRVILHRDAIEVAGWFYSRRLSFSEIRGCWATGYSRSYVFVPNNEKRGLALPPFLHTDKLFRDWIETIPKVAR